MNERIISGKGFGSERLVAGTTHPLILDAHHALYACKGPFPHCRVPCASAIILPEHAGLCPIPLRHHYKLSIFKGHDVVSLLAVG